ncbi:MAG: hypothetical protein HY066_14900 [Betaproteobacteria bacterium]|nr:hypothetical protein [Betaproteobacteria bacterium]
MAALPPDKVVGTLDTFPHLLLNHARVRGDRPATREKDMGIWQTWSWRQAAEEARAMAWRCPSSNRRLSARPCSSWTLTRLPPASIRTSPKTW